MIDIILPTWNRAVQTVECLRTLGKVTLEDYRVIWVDDGSRLDEYEKVTRVIYRTVRNFMAIRLDRNVGPTVAINTGFAASDSELVVVLNNDITVTPGWLRKLRHHMDALPELGIIAALDWNGCTNWRRVGDRKNIIHAGAKSEEGKPEPEAVSVQPEGKPEVFFNRLPPLYFQVPRNIPFCCCMIRRAAREEVGSLNESMRIFGQDNDFNERLKAAGWIKGVAVNCYVDHINHETIRDVPDLEKIRKADKAVLATLRKARQAEENKK